MVGTRRSSRGRKSDAGDRGASSIIGILLLFTLVILGAAVVFVAGSAMFDAIQTQVNSEQTQKFVEETDQGIMTAATTGKNQPLPIDEMQAEKPMITDDGSINVTWYNESGPSCSTGEKSLRALEFELDGRTIAHQGGGVWKQANGRTTVVSEPQIGYDGETLQLQILQLEEGDFGASEAVAKADHSKATDLTEEINTVAQNCPNGTSVKFTIESSYHEGWYQYLDSEFGTEANVTTDGDAVTVELTDIREPFDPAKFIVKEDHGLRGPGGKALAEDQRLARSLAGKGKGGNDVFSIKTTIKNVGQRDESQDITATILDDDSNKTLLTTTHSDLSVPKNGGERTIGHPELKFELDAAAKKKLDHGETYKYIIETEDDRTETPGTFYVGTPDSYFNVSNASHKIDENVTITADVQNIGVENTSDGRADLELEYLDDETPDAYKRISPNTVNGSYGATTTVEWTINASRMIRGDYEYSITTADDKSVTKTFTLNTGVDPSDTELVLDAGNEVNVSVMGTEVSAEGPTREQRARLVDGDKTNGKWKQSGRGEWGFTNQGWNENGGWRSDGDLRCSYYCDEPTEIWWDDDGGWDLEWTKSRYGDWSWNGPGTWQQHRVYNKRWAPVTTEIITQPVDENGNPIGESNTIQPESWGSENYESYRSPEDQNLNTHDTRDKIWKYNFTTEDRISLTLSSTLYSCSNYQKTNTDLYTDGEYYPYHDTWSKYDGNGYWDHYDCANMYGKSLEVDAATDSNKANVRVRSSENNTVPELRAGHQRQQSADEVLERGDEDLFGGKYENGTGYLDLEKGKEFVFMYELTEEAPPNTDPEEFWKEAEETDTPGDPNFNDVIVLVEVDDIPTEDIVSPIPVGEDGVPVDVGRGESDDDSSDPSGFDSGVEVETDKIIIG
ncbi:DUF7289 family protein [Natrinema altunense]